MTSLDLGSDLNRRIEFAKAFYKRSINCEDEGERKTMIEVSVSLSFSFMEGTLTYLFDHFAGAKQFSIFEQAVMSEKDVKIADGVPILQGTRYRSIEERLQFLFWRFSYKELDTSVAWWPKLRAAIDTRNQIMHPKGALSLSAKDAENCLRAVIDATNALFVTVFNRPWPKANRGLDTPVEV